MSKNLVEVIKQYLQIETNYAVIISGEYGIGKTYFFKNILQDEIRQISLPSNEKNHYRPIHISLFGKKSIEDIQVDIFLSLFTFFQQKKIKLTGGIAKVILRGAASISGLGDIDKYIKDLEPGEHVINYDEVVLCFDDLDRLSETLSLNDVFGFINTLVENEGCKIILIANEKSLLENKTYSATLREKVIGVSIEFTSHVEELYDQIISDKYSIAQKSYFDFLKDRKSIIIDAIRKNANNIRNLIFFLEHFKLIYNSLESEFQVDKDFRILKDEKLNSVLNFALAISIEYKTGELNSTTFNEIKKDDALSLSALHSLMNQGYGKKEKEEVKSYWEIFKEKYYSKNKYYYFQALFKFITGQAALSIENLKTELQKYFIVEDGEVPEHQKLLSELDWNQFIKLSDKKYAELTKQMLSYVEEGKYNLDQYPSLFRMATRFNNLVGFKIPNLVKRFKKGIVKGANKYKYNYHFNFYISVNADSEFSEETKEIMDFCSEINDSLLMVENKEKLNNLFNLFIADFPAFEQKVQESNNEWRFDPFWTKFHFNKTYNKIISLKNNEILELSYYFKDRYRVHIYEKNYPEKEFLLKLQDKLKTKLKSKKSIKNGCLQILVNAIVKSLKNFPST